MKENGQTALVVGGGPAGIEAALKISQMGYKALLIEKNPELGGTLRLLFSSFPRWENPQELVNKKLQILNSCPNVKVMTTTTIKASQRQKDGFLVTLQDGKGSTKQEKVAATVLATGFDLFDPHCYGEYGYGIYPNVLTSLEFENKLREWKTNKNGVKAPAAIAFIKCVGSRDRSKGYPYCSKLCCMYTAKQAGLVKDLFPDIKSYVFYMDYRAAGREYEEFVRSVIEDKHVRYVRGRPSKVLPENGRLLLRSEDTLMGVPIEVAVDMVVLATAIVPRTETKELAELFGAQLDRYGFLEHDFDHPVQVGERVFFAGACGFAVETLGAQYQGAAAAAEIVALFNQASQGGK